MGRLFLYCKRLFTSLRRKHGRSAVDPTRRSFLIGAAAVGIGPMMLTPTRAACKDTGAEVWIVALPSVPMGVVFASIDALPGSSLEVHLTSDDPINIQSLLSRYEPGEVRIDFEDLAQEVDLSFLSGLPMDLLVSSGRPKVLKFTIENDAARGEDGSFRLAFGMQIRTFAPICRSGEAGASFEEAMKTQLGVVRARHSA